MSEIKIQEIKQQIIAAKNNYPEIAQIDSTSTVSTFGLIAYIVAQAGWSLRTLWSIFTAEFDQKVKEQKAFRLEDFQRAALDFRLGHPLDPQTYEYIADGYTDEEILEAQIIKRAAVIEVELNNRKNLFIKTARVVNGDLSALTELQLEALSTFFSKWKPAGTKLVIFSGEADDLRLTLNFEYDPLIFDENGQRIDGSNNTVVQDAINDYLINLKFNGEFIISELETRLRALEGCVDREAYVINAERNFKNPPEWDVIDSSIVSNSGYMRITPDNLTINFIPKRNAL